MTMKRGFRERKRKKKEGKDAATWHSQGLGF